MSQAAMLRQASDSSCECLGWQDAFHEYHADCQKQGDVVCSQFFMSLPNEGFCLSEGPGVPQPKQWCYVSASCASGASLTWAGENQKTQATASAKFRWCDAEKFSLSHMAPLELKQWALKSDVDAAVAATYAYPTFNHKMTLDIMNFFGTRPPANSKYLDFAAPPLDLFTSAQLQGLVNAGTPVLIRPDDKDGKAPNPPFGIIKGQELYYINFSDEYEKVMRKGVGSGVAFTHRGIMNDIKCVANCANGTSFAWTSPVNAIVDPKKKAKLFKRL